MPDLHIHTRNFVFLVPLVLVGLAGLIVALVRWRRHPGVSLLTTIALGLYFANFVVSLPLMRWLVRRDHYGTASPDELIRQLDSISFAFNLASGITAAASYALLLCAAFGWRLTAGGQPPAELS